MLILLIHYLILHRIFSFTKLFSAFAQVKELPETAWRKSGIKHFRNSCYFDFIENLDVIINEYDFSYDSFSRRGDPVISEVVGFIQVKCEMSGIPEMSMVFVVFFIFNFLRIPDY